MRPLLLLDVDGVLNAVTPRPDPDVWPDWREGTASAAGRTWPIRWSPSVVDAVAGWRGAAEVQWLTTWGHEANGGLRELLGLPELPVAGTHADADVPPQPGEPDPLLPGSLASMTPAAPDELTGRWWKFDLVRRIVRADPTRPLVWVDDDLAGQAGVREWVQRESRCLLVVPSPQIGLSPDDLAAITAFLHRCAH